jgi:hypothetical protein
MKNEERRKLRRKIILLSSVLPPFLRGNSFYQGESTPAVVSHEGHKGNTEVHEGNHQNYISLILHTHTHTDTHAEFLPSSVGTHSTKENLLRQWFLTKDTKATRRYTKAGFNDSPHLHAT